MPPTLDAKAFERGARRAIPCEFNMISGSMDSEESYELYNAARNFDLPNVKGKEGGLCTSAFLHTMYQNMDTVLGQQASSSSLTCQQLLTRMKTSGQAKGHDSIPQMTSSRPLKKERPFYVVPPDCTGRCRALLIGINYTGQKGALRAPINDAHNVQQFLLSSGRFTPAEMLVLADDGVHPPPTKANIQKCFAQMVADSRAGDVLFISFSGHGGRAADKDGDEEDGYDSSLMPLDFKTAGQIVDDDILKYIIKAIPSGVHATMLVDACHCGSVGDLPYTYAAGARDYDTKSGFNMDTCEEAASKDREAHNAEEERKRAKAERKMEREAIRQRRSEEEAAEAAMPSSTRNTSAAAPIVLQANSVEEMQALASRFGGNLSITPAQLAKQGGGTLSTGPIMMTSEQAAAFQAQHQKGQTSARPHKIIMGAPQVVTAAPRATTKKTTAKPRSMASTTKPRSTVTVTATRPSTSTKSHSKPMKSGVSALRNKFGD